LNLGHVLFYCVAIPLILKRDERVRGLALFWCGSILTILFVIVFEELFGTYSTKDVVQFSVAYGGYILVPVVILVRFWSDPVWEKNAKAKRK
jgi:hypothetical protein